MSSTSKPTCVSFLVGFASNVGVKSCRASTLQTPAQKTERIIPEAECESRCLLGSMFLCSVKSVSHVLEFHRHFMLLQVQLQHPAFFESQGAVWLFALREERNKEVKTLRTGAEQHCGATVWIFSCNTITDLKVFFFVPVDVTNMSLQLSCS